jgi:hypothetical protein
VHGRVPRPLLLLIAAATAVTAAAVVSAESATVRIRESWLPVRPVQDTGSLAGEAGLAVWRSGDSVTVAWLTDGARAGELEVHVGDRVVFETQTPEDTAHRVSFEAGADDELRLVYGSADASWQTVIRPDRGDQRPRAEWPAPDSIVVVSDIHGEYDRMTAVLRNAGILDEAGHWAGGSKRLVVVGDVFDRGSETTRTLWFLYRLQPEAEAAGGRMHLVLGNHELMVMLGDLRYVSSRDSTVARLHATTFNQLYHPSESVIGRWLVGQPGLIRLGDLLFAHGGVSTDYVDWRLEAWRDTLWAYTHEELFNRWTDSTYIAPMDSVEFERRWQFIWGTRSVFWFRGYARSDSLGAQLDSILDRFDARVHIIGHTPVRTITQMYGGRLIDVNTVTFVEEALLLVRRGDEWERYRITDSGPPEPLDPPPF